MQIHELNNFIGTPGANDYFATDNGTDTSKISATNLYAPLNARIDNIIAGPAPSAEEIVDARLGADRVTYSSLGDAIRGQVTDLKSDFNNAIISEIGKNLFDGVTEDGYLASNGTVTTYSDWKTVDYIPVDGLTAVTTSGKSSSDGTRKTIKMFFLCTYSADKTFIEQIGTVDNTYTVGLNVAFIRFSWHSTDYSELQVESGTSQTGYEPYSVEYCFSKSPYIDEYTVSKFNLYDKNNNIYGEYITPTGSIGSDSSAVRCMVPCQNGDILEICRPQKPTYSTGSGLMLVYDSTMTVLASVDMDEYATIKYGLLDAVRYPVALSGAAYISFNVKMASYDSTNDTVVTNRNINGEATGDYISEIEGKKLWAVNSNGNDKWKEMKWVAVGDSLTDINVRTDIHYYDYISDATGIEVVNMGNSGSGYISEKDLGTAFFQRISSVPTDADVITIFGSFNDLGTGADLGTATDTGTTTIGGCINTCFDNLFTVYPLAIIGVIAPTPWVNANPTTEPNNASRYCDLLEQICKSRSIPYLDLFHSSLLRPWDSAFRSLAYSKDEGNGVHPDETGHKIIAPRIEAFLDELLLH